MNSASVAAAPSVLVVDDEPVLSDTVKNYLGRTGMSTQTCGNGLAALDLIRAIAPDVVMLDLGLPGMSGVEMCRQLRAFSDYYALMLAARVDEVDKLTGSLAGADNYMTKSFSPRELVARIQVLLKRLHAGSTGATATVVHRISAPILDPSSRRVELDALPVELIRTESDLLQALVECPGWVLSRRQLTDAVWDKDWVDDDHLVDVYITHPRKKLGDGPSQPRPVQTVCGVGYRMDQGQWCRATRAAAGSANYCESRWLWWRL